MRLSRFLAALRVGAAFSLMFIGGVFLANRVYASDTLVAASSAGGSYYGMYCNGNCVGAQFTLSSSYYVSTIDVVLRTPTTAAITTFAFSLLSSPTDPATTIASQALTLPAGVVSTQSIDVYKTLPAGTYYLVAGVPGYFGTSITAGDVDGWLMSTGVYDNAAGTVTNGVGGFENGQWVLSTPPGNSGYYAPAFSVNGSTSENGGQPTVTLNTPAPGATELSGFAYNVDPNTTKVVIYALTNQWYVQPLIDAPYTNIASDGSWSSFTNPWSELVVLLVNTATYTPMATEITNPALDPGVLAYAMYPAGPASLSFSGYTWGVKITGNAPGDQFDPGPNFWSNDPSVVNVASDGLHLKINKINGVWQSGEVYLTNSLGYGTYTVQVSSHLDQLGQNTVAAPLFIYAAPGQELDNEYSGSGGLIPAPNTGQFVVQPYTVPGNISRYVQPSAAQFTSQMEWAADHVTFTTWNGWSSIPAPADIIYQWTYKGSYIPPPGQERVHINLWLLNGAAPINGVGDEMIINSFTFQTVSTPLQFVPVAPCRVADTRNSIGPFGGPELMAGTSRTFVIPSSACGIPSTAAAYSMNVTVVPDGGLGFLSVWPAGQSQPVVSTLNSDGRVKANAAIVAAGTSGGISVYASDPTHVILDIDGYFVPAESTSLAFYPITPCRVADTRNPIAALGGPYLPGGVARAFPISSSSCPIPSTAMAYSLNFTAIPHGPLWFLSVWPSGEAQPWVSTLNSAEGAVTANGAIVPAGVNGNISVYATNDADVVIDANGYFAARAAGGLSLYTVRPCRVLDTRSSSGDFSGVLTVNVTGTNCGAIAAPAHSFVLNATVVPSSPLGYLTLWPNGEIQPYASTLNASDSAVTSNLAIVPVNNDLVNVFASSATQLILDISGFFAP